MIVELLPPIRYYCTQVNRANTVDEQYIQQHKLVNSSSKQKDFDTSSIIDKHSKVCFELEVAKSEKDATIRKLEQVT
jgi:hypothetical protein